MKNTIITALLVMLSIQVKAQIQYSYDAHGNRTQKNIIVQRAGQRLLNPNEAKENKPDETINLALEYGLSIFPNPTSNDVNLDIQKLKEEETVTIQIFDASGKVLEKLKNVKSKDKIAMSHLQAGTYYLMIEIDGVKRLSYKVQKM
jgi:hypothetical protein